MPTLRYAAFLAIILVLQSYSASADINIPFLSPLLGEDPCTPEICGKGKCVNSSSNAAGFECICDKGWKQARSDDDQFFKFLPCVIPNCSLNFHCEEAPPPAVDKQMKSNSSVFDPCFWSDCGGGSCNQTSLITHTCLCNEGYHNLLNSTAFACYKECTIGGDCAALGLNMFNSSSASSPHPSSTVVDDSYASSVIPRTEFGWLITMLTTLTLAFSKYS